LPNRTGATLSHRAELPDGRFCARHDQIPYQQWPDCKQGKVPRLVLPLPPVETWYSTSTSDVGFSLSFPYDQAHGFEDQSEQFGFLSPSPAIHDDFWNTYNLGNVDSRANDEVKSSISSTPWSPFFRGAQLSIPGGTLNLQRQELETLTSPFSDDSYSSKLEASLTSSISSPASSTTTAIDCTWPVCNKTFPNRSTHK